MNTSPAGRKTLMLREGFKTKAYKDTKGIWTIGVGHTSAAGPPLVSSSLTLTEQQVSELFARDLEKYEKTVNDSIKVSLNQNQYDACVSLCYNIGQSGFAGSTVVRKLNAKDYKGAADAFLMWNKPVELLGRRKSEYLQFLSVPISDEGHQLIQASTVKPTEKPVETVKAPQAPVVAKTTDKPPTAPPSPSVEAPKGTLGEILLAKLRKAFSWASTSRV